jgi:DNA-binding response OmpR family regulator
MAANRRHSILVVEDDKAMRDELAELLGFDDEFEAHMAAAYRPALDILAERHVDLILLDVGLPGIDGRQACRNLRQRGHATPIIMLTGQSGEAETILGLECGANDYVHKPYRAGELLARIRVQLRSHELSRDAVFALGPYTFRPAVNALVGASGEVKVRLTDRETALLRHLYQAGGERVSRETLLKDVFGMNPFADTHTLETHIYRLRRKLEPGRGRPSLLRTERGGYRLVVSDGGKPVDIPYKCCNTTKKRESH